jgi:hypothetical protein
LLAKDSGIIRPLASHFKIAEEAHMTVDREYYYDRVWHDELAGKMSCLCIIRI